MDYNSSENFVRMSAKCFAAVNVPLSAVGILLNMFFVFCMFFPPQGAEQLKPFLKVLLGSQVGCNTVIHLCSCFLIFYDLILWDMILGWYTVLAISNLIFDIMIYTVVTSVTCCHWKNMFYFCQIVPPQHPFLVWFKSNIKALTYSGLLLNAIFCVFGMAVDVALEITQIQYFEIGVSTEIINDLLTSADINYQIISVNIWTRLALILLSVCVMLVSSFATVLYLWRHMKNVEESGISSPRLQRQIKVIITSITVQALLHFICSNWILMERIMKVCTTLNFDGYVLFTISSFYSFGTTINMGISQSLFRQGAIHVWKKLCETQFLISVH